jgi:hypothetical protein
MKKIRFIALAAVLGITSWIATHPAAEAYPGLLCKNVTGTACSVKGSTGSCWDQACGLWGSCTCSSPPLVGKPDPSWICTSPCA